MPQVPLYQNGVPQVGDNGQGPRVSGMSVGTIPGGGPDWRRTTALAAQPLDALANTYADNMKIAYARETKALADDVDTKVSQLVRTTLYDPNHGYFTQRGEDAAKTYAATKKSLSDGLQGIIQGLPAVVRDQVRSGVDARLNGAVAQMDRWNEEQTSQHQIAVAKANIEEQINTAAANYNNPEMVERSLGQARLQTEYIARRLGLGSNLLNQALTQQRDAFQGAIYGAKANDNPLQAFADLQRDKENMSPKLYGQLNDNLFSAAREEMAIATANALPRNMTRNQLVQWIRNPNAKTGIALVDGLEPGRRAQVLTSAFGLVERDQEQKQGSLSLAVENSLARARDLGHDDQALTLDQFEQTYGKNEGQQRYARYWEALQTQGALSTMGKSSEEVIAATLQAAQPELDDPDYAAKSKYWHTLQKAAGQVREARVKDPVGYAVAAGLAGYAPLDWNNPQKVQEQLQKRTANAHTLAQYLGTTTPQIYTTDELSQLRTLTQKMEPDQAAGTVAMVSQALGREGVQIMARQTVADKSLAGMEIPYTMAMDSYQQAAIPDYLNGAAAAAAGKVKIAYKPKEGLSSSKDKAADPIDPEGSLRTLYRSPDQYNAARAMITNVANAKIAQGETQEEAIDQATKAVIGTVIKFNGAPIVLRGNVDADDVLRALRQKTKDLISGQGEVLSVDGSKIYKGREAADLLLTAFGNPKRQLRATGEPNTFAIADGNEVLRDPQGNPITIQVTPLSPALRARMAALPDVGADAAAVINKTPSVNIDTDALQPYAE